ncbi:MAG: 2TM domain-containing protein [Alphaproteobacteria bacterium]|nr:2TM domain-containing protein [Alphaproteobacteria bacterium]
MANRRIRGFRVHLLIYGVIAVFAVLINLVLDGTLSWALFVIVAWGAPLAVHCAYAMNLFGGSE